MTKILMVCLGNICRSPLAEGIMRSKLLSTHFFIDSAGTSGFHSGNAPDPRSIEVAQKNGIPYSLINRAKKKIERGKVRFDRTIAKLQKERSKLEKTEQSLKLNEQKKQDLLKMNDN